jgi:cyclophilin family peptidyl-prolyl cis-trans isomerase
MSSLSKYSKLIAHSLVLILLLTAPLIAQAKTAVISTSLGDIEIELLENDAPKTVANFLRYVEDNRYENTFIHRSVDDFIIQGGGFSFSNDTTSAVTTFDPVENEFKISNTRGTVAMAKLGGDPDSATSQWFINLGDNSGNLDGQNGGFTVFARVIGDGMEVADAINQLQIINGGGPFAELPVINFSGDTIKEEHLVFTAVSEKSELPPFQMNPGLNDAWFNSDTDGQGFFVTIFPERGIALLAWFTYDTELPPQNASANLGDPGHRWLTAVGPIDGNHALLEIEFASGGLFDQAAEIDRRVDGTITLSFDDCNSGTVDYDIPSIDRQGSVPIKRVAADNAALCEALSPE